MTKMIKRPMTALADMLDRQKETISEMAPGADLKKLFGLVRYAISTEPDLGRVVETQHGRVSIVQAAAKLAQLGLEPTGKVGGAYLVRYKDKVQVLPYWGSYRSAAVESGAVTDLYVVPIHERDKYTWAIEGGRQVFTMTSDPFSDRGSRKGWMFVAVLPNGTPIYEPITPADIDPRRKVGGPFWRAWPLEAELKTAIKVGIARRIPLQSHRKLADLIATDDAAEIGEDTAPVIELDVTPQEEPKSRSSALRDELEAKPTNGAAVTISDPEPAFAPPSTEAIGDALTEAGIIEAPNKGPAKVVCPYCDTHEWTRIPTRMSSTGDLMCVNQEHGSKPKRFFKLTMLTESAFVETLEAMPTDKLDAAEAGLVAKGINPHKMSLWSEVHGQRALSIMTEIKNTDTQQELLP